MITDNTKNKSDQQKVPMCNVNLLTMKHSAKRLYKHSAKRLHITIHQLYYEYVLKFHSSPFIMRLIINQYLVPKKKEFPYLKGM